MSSPQVPSSRCRAGVGGRAHATPRNRPRTAWQPSSDSRVTSSPGVCAIAGSPGPKLRAGTPCAAKRATSVHPSLGRTPRSNEPDELGHERVPEVRRRGDRGVEHLDLVGIGNEGTRLGLRDLHRHARGEAPVHDDAALVGYDVVGDPALDPHRLERLAVLQPVDVDRTGVGRGDPSERRGGPMDGVGPHPGTRGVGPGAAVGGPHVERALAPRLDPPLGGLEQDREVAGHELGRAGEEVAQSVPLLGDLLPDVEDERGVEARRRRRARPSPRPGRA